MENVEKFKENRDWTGNASVRNCNLRSANAEKNDYYATEPKAVELLLENETFSHNIFECACGEGHISEVLKSYGYNVASSDLIDRGYGEVANFFDCESIGKGTDIITNPPYKYAKEFVEHSLKITESGTKIAMFLKLTFLEGKGRRELFKNNPPKVVYVSSSRLQCGKNGCFNETSMVAYAWFVWENGYKGDPIIKWIN